VDEHRIVVRAHERVRLDVYLTRRLPRVSRHRIQRHIACGDVLVDGRRARSSRMLQGGEVLSLPTFAARTLDAASESVAFSIVHEDDDLVVVDKPAGVLVHPVGAEFRRTLLNGLHRHLVERGEDPRELGIVHRLDRLTSGLLVVAKRLAARRRLSEAVERRLVRRAYVAIATGRPEPARGCIDLDIRRDPGRPTRMQALDARAAAAAAAARLAIVRPHVSASGYSDPRLDLRPRAARTHYATLRRLPGAALLRLVLDTGRTHQIRVHLQAIGCPLVGDPLYGCGPEPEIPAAVRRAGARLGRPALHASQLAFAHPRTGAPLRFRAPLPADLRDALAVLESDAG
jgi:23S rRNA pseudouridine1911/1915/1917 synthase